MIFLISCNFLRLSFYISSVDSSASFLRLSFVYHSTYLLSILPSSFLRLSFVYHSTYRLSILPSSFLRHTLRLSFYISSVYSSASFLRLSFVYYFSLFPCHILYLSIILLHSSSDNFLFIFVLYVYLQSVIVVQRINKLNNNVNINTYYLILSKYKIERK